MRGEPDPAAALASARSRQSDHERLGLSDEEEFWIARQLEKAPPLCDASRRKIEQLLAFPPDHVADIRNEPRAS